MSYSDYFSFGSGPALEQKTGIDWGGSGLNGIQHFSYNTVGEAKQNKEAAAKFDAQMAGHDATSASYVATLKGIYDGYGKYAQEFGDKAQPIMDALTGDIKGMEGYIKDYGTSLAESKSTFTDGVNLDPSATRTREEYQGNNAASYGKAREKMNQEQAAQGIAPSAGGNRAINLAEAAGSTSAANTAYKDWRTQYNNDIVNKQNGLATYQSLLGKQGDLQGQVMSARGGLISANKDIMQAKIGAGEAQAAGYQDLASLEEARRQETLALGQQQQNNARMNDDLKQQAAAKLTSFDKYASTNGGWINN
jgi:hypothetical protein